MTGLNFNLKDLFWEVVHRLFPLFEFREASRFIDREAWVAEYREEVEDVLDGRSGDIEEILDTAVDTHRSELERSSRLDSKAGNYLGNIGVVLSILSLIPVLTVVLGLDGQRVFSGGWPVFVAIVIFGYSVLALLLSAYYSSKALKMRAYRVYFDADTMKDWIGRDDLDDEEILANLLECQRNNEIYNLEKNNAISVAGTFSRNGIIGLGIGIGWLILVSLPYGTLTEKIGMLFF